MEIPDLKLDEKQKVVAQTIDVPIKINGTDAVVTMQKISTGERNKIQGQCTSTKIIGGQPNVVVNSADVQELMLFAVIVKAPFDKTLSGIKELPASVSDYLYSEYRDFAEPSDKKKD